MYDYDDHDDPDDYGIPYNAKNSKWWRDIDLGASEKEDIEED